MSETRLLTALERVDRALQAEIEIIREGRFQELQAVQKETAQAMMALDGSRSSLSIQSQNKPIIDAAIQAVARRAETAQGLIGSALHGAKNARERLSAIAQSDGEVGAYDRTGGQLRMKTIGSPYNKTI